MIYLDYAAGTPLDASVLKSMMPYLTDNFYNPSAVYLASRWIKKDVDEARAGMARLLGCQPGELIFTAGGTEADNLAIYGVMSQFTEANLLVSGLEHAAVLAAAADYQHKIVPVKPSGLVDLDQLEAQIDDQTVLISVLWASNELGTLQPIRKITRIVEKIRMQRAETGNNLPLLVHSDASQAAAWCDLNVNRSRVDLMTINGGKIYGPKQTGLLYVRHGLKLTPLIKGGGQEQGLRSGTTNAAGVVGLSKAFDLVNRQRRQQSERLVPLRDNFENKLLQNRPAVVISGAKSPRLPNFSNLVLPAVDGERLVMELDEQGVMAATGAACSASSHQPSRALKAIGLSLAQANSTLRISLGYPTTKSELDEALRVIIKLTV